jgi:hypothetical protein
MGPQELGNVLSGRVPFDVRVGREDHFADFLPGESSQQRTNLKIVGTYALER